MRVIAQVGFACCWDEADGLRLEVTGDVEEHGTDATIITLLSAVDLDSPHKRSGQYTQADLEGFASNDIEDIKDALWLRYLEVQADIQRAMRQVEDIAESLRTHVRLALQSGTQRSKVDALLQRAQAAALEVPAKEAA